MQRKIELTHDGYASGVRHGTPGYGDPHSGNTRYAPSGRGWYQCAGCGHFISADALARALAGRRESGADIYAK